MDDPIDRDEERNKLVQDWHAYGADFGVFVPQTAARADRVGPRHRGV